MNGPGVGLAVLAFVLNLSAAIVPLAYYADYSTLVQLYAGTAVMLAALNLALGLAAFATEVNGLLGCFAALATSSSALLGSVMLVGAMQLRYLCSLQQIAFNGCQDFNSTVCTLQGACTSLQLEGTACEAPPADLCDDLSEATAMVGTIAGLAIVFNVLPAAVALAGLGGGGDAQTVVPQAAEAGGAPSPAANAEALAKLREEVAALKATQAEQVQVLKTYGDLLQGGAAAAAAAPRRRKKKARPASAGGAAQGQPPLEVGPPSTAGDLEAADPAAAAAPVKGKKKRKKKKGSGIAQRLVGDIGEPADAPEASTSAPAVKPLAPIKSSTKRRVVVDDDDL